MLASVPDCEPVIVYRDGTVSNRWYDGVKGVPAEIARLAAEDESPCDPDSEELADTWRNVEADGRREFSRPLRDLHQHCAIMQ